MELKCYLVSDDKRKAKKNRGNVIYTLNAKLQAPCNQLNPVFVLDGDHTDFNYIDANWNGAHKYYFVTNFVFLPGHMLEVHCHEDTLSTFWRYKVNEKPEDDKGLWKKLAFIERQESRGSDFIVDEKLPVETKRNITHLMSDKKLGSGTGTYIALTVSGGV